MPWHDVLQKESHFFNGALGRCVASSCTSCTPPCGCMPPHPHPPPPPPCLHLTLQGLGSAQPHDVPQVCRLD